jgi:S-(hydroxymethyl)glutathione dehydrogenase / alcohol dehydrogenase
MTATGGQLLGDKTVRAAICTAFGEPLVIEDVDLAAPGPGEIKVEVAACAICHSDIIYAEGGWGGVLPAVYGHEAAGVVVEAGDGVSGISAGDHVVVTLIRSCGTCAACVQGTPVTCEKRFALDAKSPLTRSDGQSLVQGLRTGAFAEYIVVEASQAVVIPKSVRFDSASLLACGVITGFGAVTNTASMPPGAFVVVIGAGGVGLNTIQAAAIGGARAVVALDVVDAKLNAAQRFGATHALRADAPDVVNDVRRLADGRGADFVFVAVGARPAIAQAFGMTARSGAVVLVGIPASGVMVEIDPGSIASDNQRILGSKMGGARIQEDIPKLVELYQQGALKLDELISGRYPLERINEAIASVKSGEALRNVITFR